MRKVILVHISPSGCCNTLVTMLSNGDFGFPYCATPAFSTPAVWCRVFQSRVFSRPTLIPIRPPSATHNTRQATTHFRHVGRLTWGWNGESAWTVAYKKKLSARFVCSYIYLRTSHAGKTAHIFSGVCRRVCVCVCVHPHETE